MTNEEIYEKMMQIGKQMDDLYKANRLHERNELVPIWRELNRSYDWGFRTGDKIETRAWSKYWQAAKITDYEKESNSFLVKNDKGWEVWVPGSLIRKLQREPEQLNLFEVTA